MQVGPSVRGFDMDNSSAENAAVVRYTGKISLHARVIYRTGFIVAAVLQKLFSTIGQTFGNKRNVGRQNLSNSIRKLIR